MSQKVKFTPFDLETLFPFAEECSVDIIRDIEEGNFEADPSGYTPEDCLGHLVMWGETNSLSVLNVMEGFNWRALTSELGLCRGCPHRDRIFY